MLNFQVKINEKLVIFTIFGRILLNKKDAEHL